MTIETIHRKDEQGEQVTERVVHTEDAETGESFEHRFTVTADGYDYQGEGEPPAAAVRALERFDARLASDSSDEEGGREAVRGEGEAGNQGEGQ